MSCPYCFEEDDHDETESCLVCECGDQECDGDCLDDDEAEED